jgi:poly(glycerol-phosphate) alpha-glucosyltransferase
MLFVDNYLHRASCIHSLCLPETLAIRKYGLKNPICQIPNGVLLPDKQTVYPPPAWLQQFPPGKKILLYLGRIHPKKGLPLLLKAWAWLHKQRSPHTEEWGLAIAGWDQGGHLAVLRNMVNELGLENSVRFIGFQDETAKQVTYQYVKGFILPSYSEGMPMTILEAWAHYLPVVMTKECNLPEGFTTQAAMEIKPDETDIAKRLNDLFSLSDRERTTMGNHGRHLVEEKFTWPIIATQMREVYEWILGGGPPPSSMVIE